MSTPPVFVYYSGFTLRKTRRYLFFSVSITDYCALTLLAFYLLSLVWKPSELRKVFTGLVDLVSEGVSFPILFRVCKFVDAVGFIQIVRQCSFHASLMFFAYWRSVEIDWKIDCCVSCCRYKIKTGDVLHIRKGQVLRKKRD